MIMGPFNTHEKQRTPQTWELVTDTVWREKFTLTKWSGKTHKKTIKQCLNKQRSCMRSINNDLVGRWWVKSPASALLVIRWEKNCSNIFVPLNTRRSLAHERMSVNAVKWYLHCQIQTNEFFICYGLVESAVLWQPAVTDTHKLLGVSGVCKLQFGSTRRG